MNKTIHETIDELHIALRDYIEATYHISNAELIRQRQSLLKRPGVISQIPYLESTPRYRAGARFGAMAGLSPYALRAYELLSAASNGQPAVIHDPPYKHQADAVMQSLNKNRNLVVMTGTGSGKTESFLLPILGKLAREAGENPESFEDRAVRALLLYPMNALVNDQLGRLRALFGDPRIVEQFEKWAKRPPQFARYTSRTPYAGVRSAKKDSTRLRSFEEFYVGVERLASGPVSEEQKRAADLLGQLKSKGKWPAKRSLSAWFGEKGKHWQDSRTGKFVRAITQPHDSELITRHEVQTSAPDLLVTNYSMLEYMLMRPIERTLFDATKEWLRKHEHERFLVVLDEAHLYRGAAGAEVGLLLRRLRSRLEIPADRFQVICATASFKDEKYAPNFGGQIAGVPPESFDAITGTLDIKPHAAVGTARDAEILASIDLATFYSPAEEQRTKAVEPLLRHRGVSSDGQVDKLLFIALSNFPPLGLLINVTMSEAKPISELGTYLFPGTERGTADQALTALMALGSAARETPQQPGLLPCRVHNFFRGLAGLWVCMDPACSQVTEEERSGFCGRLYSQPREQCGCGARVLEFYTCRNCGTAYARAYSDDVDSPRALWSEPGKRLKLAGVEQGQLLALDLLLEPPRNEEVCEPADYDLETGQLNPTSMGPRTRTVYLRKDRVTPVADEDGEQLQDAETRGQFVPCPVCDGRGKWGKSTVQDHQTKGDQPFQALVTRQLEVQPPSPVMASRFAPLRGRKVLVFSDSRQVAARLAPNLQMYSTRDSLRPLMIWGFEKLEAMPLIRQQLSLEDIYLAVLLAANALSVRLRPELIPGESFAADQTVGECLDRVLKSESDMLLLWGQLRADRPPSALLDDMIKSLQDPFIGVEALALASIKEAASRSRAIADLPALPGLPNDPESKATLVRAWLRCWRRNGFWLGGMPSSWWKRPRSSGTSVKGQKGPFKAMDVVLGDSGLKKAFNRDWLPKLLELFTTDADAGIRRLEGKHLSLALGGNWVRCKECRSVHRPVAGLSHCIDCGGTLVAELKPDADPVFAARKGYYRNPVLAALGQPPRPPIALIAAEHTAQLNAPQTEDVFSKAEENELLFQDIQISASASHLAAVDVLSSTTTMEVGIDIGALSGVALRNMPPSRANYQQRAGRAGRRGNAVATVVAFGNADSHDEHYFEQPDGMIRGPVVDPQLTLDNPNIARRHIRAYLLQRYHQERLPKFDPSAPPDLFSVLGTVSGFRSGGVLNQQDFEQWLRGNEAKLQGEVRSWIPSELSKEDRALLLDTMLQDCIEEVKAAVASESPKADGKDEEEEEDQQENREQAEEEGDARAGRSPRTSKLLDRLLYHGVLPRYAFPTDVASFNVFDVNRSTRFRPVMRFAPSQGLPVALSQYAPGKQVWIAGKCYTSGAVYSTMPDERFNAWNERLLYLECKECRFARTVHTGKEIDRDDVVDCPACGAESSFGPARFWFRPPGFAHPVDKEEATSPDDVPETSYATRAKLTMQTPPEEGNWTRVGDRLRLLTDRTHLLVSNTGPDSKGYSYCAKCGRIEASTEPTQTLFGPHRKPYPDDREDTCDGTRTSRHIVLGTDYITDIALFSLRVAAPLKLKPGIYSTDVALRTLSEALAKAACLMLEIEPGEVMAEFRPALTPAGQSGLEAEVFLYDTLPGGAGFSSQLLHQGDALFREALRLMSSCPEDCDSSCYRCLRSFKNKFEHGLLDRHVGRALAEYLLTGDLPTFDSRRLANSTTLLFNDLLRNAPTATSISRDVSVNVPGIGPVTVPIIVQSGGKRVAVALAVAFTNDYPAEQAVRDMRENWDGLDVLAVNELLVRCNLPAATRRILEAVR